MESAASIVILLVALLIVSIVGSTMYESAESRIAEDCERLGKTIIHDKVYICSAESL